MDKFLQGIDAKIAKFTEWQNLSQIEANFWDVADFLEKQQSWFEARHAKRNRGDKLRDEILPLVQHLTALNAKYHNWDWVLSARCNLHDRKTPDGSEYDAEVELPPKNKIYASTAVHRFVEITRGQVSVKCEKEEDMELTKIGFSTGHLSDSEDWRKLIEIAKERFLTKVNKKSYPQLTTLVLYFDGNEAPNAINWFKEERGLMEDLERIAARSFDELFMWGPNAECHYADLKL